MKELVKHDIPLEPMVVETFSKLASNRDRLTEVFTLTKERIKQVQMCVVLQKNRVKRYAGVATTGHQSL